MGQGGEQPHAVKAADPVQPFVAVLHRRPSPRAQLLAAGIAVPSVSPVRSSK
jgi:hypothetical protein